LAVNKRKILDTARKYVQKGAKQKALKEFERLLKLDPKDGKLRLEIGDAHRRWGQTDEAVAQYLKVADQYKADGFDARSVAVYKQVLNLDPKRHSAHVSLAELYQRMGLDAEAIAALQTAADGYHKEGKKREALELLRKMATLDPSNTTSRLKVADLLKQEGMSNEAVVEFEAVANELVRNGSLDQVVSVYARILEIQPRRVEILSATARALIQLHKPERAEPFARKAVDADSDNTEHYELLCDVYKALGRGDQLAETTRALARIHRERGDDERAREIMQRLPASDGLDIAADAGDGFVADAEEQEIHDDELLDDDFLAAEDEFEPRIQPEESSDAFGDSFDASEHVASSPSPAAAPAEEPVVEGDPEQLLAEASVYLRYGKCEQAIASLKGVLAQEPDNRDALEKLGEAQAETGDERAAVDSWRRAAELARDAGDGDALEILCDRIAAIDPDAAADLAPADTDEEPAADDGLSDVEFELSGSDDVADSEQEESDAGLSAAADDGFELELDIDSGDAGPAEEPEAAQAASEPDPVLGDDSDLDIDIDVGEEAPAAEASSGSSSGTASQRIADDLEEAEFYFNQGLLDEAEAAYRRVLEAAPQHPAARLRLGEIEAARSLDGDGADATPEIDIDADGEGLDLAAQSSDESDPDTTQSEIEFADDDTGVDLADALAGDDDSTEESDADAESGGGYELDLDDDSEIDLAAAAAEAAQSVGRKTAAHGDLSKPTLEQVEEEAPEEEPEPARPAPAAKRSRADDTQPMREPQGGSAQAAVAADSGDEDTFDLAAELRDAFEEEADANEESGVLSTVEDGFAAIFSEFKKGVSATLSEADTETRYDLGIAYREMGLYEDAIGEFRVCLVSPDRMVDSLMMMGLCALDLGRPSDAVSHFQQALAGDELNDTRRAGVSFDLGRAYEQLGDAARAKSAYEAVAAIDPDFPEIQERIQALAYADSSPSLDTRLAAPAMADGEYESFDDLLGDAEEVEEAPEAEAFESFDDVLSEAEVVEDEPDPPAPAPPPAAAKPAPASPPEPEKTPDPGPSRAGRGRKKISFV